MQKREPAKASGTAATPAKRGRPLGSTTGSAGASAAAAAAAAAGDSAAPASLLGPSLQIPINFTEQNNKRIVLALQSGLKSELTWALNTLSMLSFKEKDDMRRDATPLAKIPGLLDALLQIIDDWRDVAVSRDYKKPSRLRLLGGNSVVTGFGNAYELASSIDASSHPGPKNSLSKLDTSSRTAAKNKVLEWWYEEDGLFNLDDEGRSEKQQCAVAASNIIRNFSFMPENEMIMAQHRHCLETLVQCIEDQYMQDEELITNAVETLVNLSPLLDLRIFSSSKPSYIKITEKGAIQGIMVMLESSVKAWHCAAAELLGRLIINPDNKPFLLPSAAQGQIDVSFCGSMMLTQCKKRKMPHNGGAAQASLPTVDYADYFVVPSIAELEVRESTDPGYCSRVPNFVIGRVGYGCIKFLGDTDIRWMELDQIVKFNRNCVVVYENDSEKPPVGYGLNKTAEVTLILQLRLADSHGLESNKITAKLQKSTDKQGAKFLSFDQSSGEWKFLVNHFSRFGLDEDEEEDIIMEDVVVRPIAEEHERTPGEFVLTHSLPAHLGLDPGRMQELRMLMFPAEDEDEDIGASFPSDNRKFDRKLLRENLPSSSARSSLHKSALQGSAQKAGNRASTSPMRKAPLPLLEYAVNSSDISPARGILMIGQNKGLPLRVKRSEGFILDGKHAAPLTGKYSSNIVDAALFMGRSFRVGWGPNGMLVHTGIPVGKTGTGLSSIIHLEKVAIDNVVRDDQNKLKEELVDFCFSFPLNLHKSLDHETLEIKVDSYKLKLQKVVCTRSILPEICCSYIGIIEKQLEVSGLSTSTRVLLMHQVTVWELIKVLFSEREDKGNSRTLSDDDGEDMVLDRRDGSLNIDAEASPFVRRAEFSYWLQDSVCHRVQEEVSCLNDTDYLENIFVLLTGRQLDAAVELAASKGDVRLAILLSQAGASMVNRSDMSQQLNLWKINGLDFSYIERDRLKLYELLAGDIEGALQDSSVDWKRYLGLVMWYQLLPDTTLPAIIHTYEQLLSEGRAPHPVPIYIDEGPTVDQVEWNIGDRYDMAYYLMLLHANKNKSFELLKTMFSAFSSTLDPLDYHMIWHQRALLESIGAFHSKDLHVVDVSLVSQLLCLGQCHWAVYVVIHMTYDGDEFPHIQVNLIKEILLQYCETWNTSEKQRQFIEDLGIPPAWMHEALAIYSQYYGDLLKALDHYLQCSNWQKAHSIFMTTVGHSLFLSSNDSEIWRITSLMEEHKSEIADWDIGAGIYIDFYIIRSTLQEEIATSEPDLLAKKNEEYRNFFRRLNESLRVWGSRLPVDARATFSRMAEELCNLLESTPGGGSTPSVQMSCFETMLGAPIPEDLRAGHLQDAVSVFTYLLTQAAPSS